MPGILDVKQQVSIHCRQQLQWEFDLTLRSARVLRRVPFK
jgi:hypothetical protein